MSLPLIIKDIEDRLKLSGGTLTGSLFINNGYAYAGGSADESIFLSRRNSNDEKYSRYISITSKENIAIDNSITFVERNNDVWKTYKLYGEHNKPTASDVGAPTTTGSGASGTWPISITGSAAKLSSARNIALDGAVTGGATFDGTSAITINTTAKEIYNENDGTKWYHNSIGNSSENGSAWY